MASQPSGPDIRRPLDSASAAGILGRMIRRLISAAMRSAIEEQITPQLKELKDGVSSLNDRFDGLSKRIDGLSERIDGLSERVDRLGERVDEQGDRLDKRIDALGERLDRRIDELALQQGRMVEEVASLKRDKDSAADLTRRVGRIEDHLFAPAT